MSDFDSLRAKIDEMERKQLLGIRKCPSSPPSLRDNMRCTIHAAFVAAVDHLETKRWSRNKIATVLDVHPVTLKDWIEDGDSQRNQLPGWLIAAMTRLPSDAWAVFNSRLFARAPMLTEETGTDG